MNLEIVMLTDEEIMDIRNRAKLNDNRKIDPLPFARDVIKAVLAKAMPIPKQEPSRENIKAVFIKNGFAVKDGCSDLKQYVYDAAYDLLNTISAPSQAAANPLVDAVFAASNKKATDTHGKCPHCSHECAQAAAIPEDIEILIAEVKQQFMWRMEDSACGGDEIDESWNTTELRIRSRLSSASPKPE